MGDSPRKKARQSMEPEESHQADLIRSMLREAGIEDEVDQEIKQDQDTKNNKKRAMLKVVGVTFRKEANKNVYDSLPDNEEERLVDVRVEPEPDNAYDPNAKRVLALLPGDKPREIHIGYLPRDIETSITKFQVLMCFKTSKKYHYAKVTENSKKIRTRELKQME